MQSIGRRHRVKSLRSQAELQESIVVASEDNHDLHTDVRRLLVEQSWYGKKDVTYFQATPEAVDLIANAGLKSDPVGKNHWPVLLPEHISAPIIVRASVKPKKVRFLLADKRLRRTRDELPLDVLKDEYQDDLRNSKLTVVQDREVVSFVSFDLYRKTGLVRVSVDSLPGGTSPTNLEARIAGQMSLSARTGSQKAFSSLFSKPINLFPIVSKLWQATDGRVVELGFQAIGLSDGPTDWKPKLRRSKGTGCLRQDRFQEGGTRNISGDISPYRIRVMWDTDENGNDTTDACLLLPGTAGMVDSPAGLYSATIDGYANKNTFRFLNSKLRAYILGEE